MRKVWGAHAPRVLAMTPSSSRTFSLSRAGRSYQLTKFVAARAPQPARAARALPRKCGRPLSIQILRTSLTDCPTKFSAVANWSYKGSFTGGRADLSGLTPGTTFWVRVRKIGTKGETGGWSDPASIMVT
jgi:hypothetical protein